MHKNKTFGGHSFATHRKNKRKRTFTFEADSSDSV